MVSPRKGVGADELEQLVSSTFKDSDIFGSDIQLDLAPPSTFDHDAPHALDADAVVALDHPARSYLASTATLLRKVKSQTAAFLTLTPRLLKSPAPPPQERSKSGPRTTFPFRRASVPKESLPPLPSLSRTPAAILDQERMRLYSSDFSRTPTPATESLTSAVANGSPSSRPRRRRHLVSVFESSVRIEREIPALDEDEPPSPPPKPLRFASTGADAFTSKAVPANDLAISLSPPDLLWTPELTNASPAPSSPASSTRLRLSSNVRRPITPIDVDGTLFDHGGDPFRKDPPSPMRSLLNSSPPRPHAPRSKSTPRPYKIRPTPSPLLHPALTLASASATTLPYTLTNEAVSRDSFVSAANATNLLLPFPLPPDSSQDVISVRVSTPVNAIFPPARPPPMRPLPKTPPGSPWHPHATTALKTLRQDGGEGSQSCSTRLFRSRSESREKLAAFHQASAVKPSMSHPLVTRSRSPATALDEFSTHATSRPLPLFPAKAEPPARRRRPSSPFPLLEPMMGLTSTYGLEGDASSAAPEPHPRPPRAARHEVRAAVDAMLAGDVTFTNPWTSPTISTNDMDLHLSMRPDSDTEPELGAFLGVTRKKTSVTSTSTVSSMCSTSSMATQSAVTNATTVSPSTSPDTTSPYIPIVPLPYDEGSDPLGLVTRSTASRMHPSRAKSGLEAHGKSSTNSCSGMSADYPPSSYGYVARAGPETYYAGHSRPVSMRRSESDALPAHLYASRDLEIRISNQSQPPVAFARTEPQPHTAPAHITTFARAERERGCHSPPPRTAAPSPTASNLPSFLGIGRRRRSFLHLPAIPRVAPLNLGILGHNSERTENKESRGAGSVWFD